MEHIDLDIIFDNIITILLSNTSPAFDDKNKPIIKLNTNIYDVINDLKNRLYTN